MEKGRFNLVKCGFLIMGAAACFCINSVFAMSGIGSMATHIGGSFSPLAKFVTGGSFLVGLGFAFAAIMKFKAHRDNPTQVSIGTPIALIVIAGVLLYLPFMFGQVGQTLFGSAKPTGVGGLSGIITS